MSQQPSNFLELSSHHYRRRCHDSSHKLPHISQAERQTHQTLGSGKPANAGTPDWPKPAYEGILPEGSLRMFIGHLAHPVYKPSKGMTLLSQRRPLCFIDRNLTSMSQCRSVGTWTAIEKRCSLRTTMLEFHLELIRLQHGRSVSLLR